MAASSCSECGGRRWVRYFSETTDGNLEEAFRLCPCNYEPEMPQQGEPAHEESERVENAAGGWASPPHRGAKPAENSSVNGPFATAVSCEEGGTRYYTVDYS